jgi:hypothetical protein
MKKLKPPTNRAKEEAAILAELGLKLHRSALSRLYCKPSREKWLDETPEEGNEPDQFQNGALLMDDVGKVAQEIHLTRDEYDELKDHLAFLRRIRRPDQKAKETSKS